VADDHIVTRKQRREYEDWREATELTDEERAVGLPLLPGVEQAASPLPRPPRKERPEIYGDVPTLRERLSHVRDPNDVAEILGRRRMACYRFAITGVALASSGFVAYSIIEVARGQAYAWSLAILPAPLAIAAFSGLIAYWDWYRTLTGRQWPQAERIGRVFEVLNSTSFFRRRR
jgi:hypothetical protein